MVSAEDIRSGNLILGIELGSSTIKAVLIDKQNRVIASSGVNWENQYLDGIWTYSLDEVWFCLQKCYRQIADYVQANYGTPLTKLRCIGVSGMMHGYLAFDNKNHLLVPFRTWRNTITLEAAQKLSDVFGVYIPQRWSVAHVYQAILNGEEHVSQISFLTTLSGYVHWKLSGNKVLGIGDASGMFPVDSAQLDYDSEKLSLFNNLVERYNLGWELKNILPSVLTAGMSGGALTVEGALLLDPSGQLCPGCPLAPPEGDAGTGMVMTNCVSPGTCNLSAGTSIFAMAVMDKDTKIDCVEIDSVSTPAGMPVAMIHCNNCSSDLNQWVALFQDLLGRFNLAVDTCELYSVLMNCTSESNLNCGNLTLYNFCSGEHIAQVVDGRPMLIRQPDSCFSLPNLMQAHIFSMLCTLKMGLNLLRTTKKVEIKQIVGHGGLFKSGHIFAKALAASFSVPVITFDGAEQGGAWGIALLASFSVNRRESETIEEFLSRDVFQDIKYSIAFPDAKETEQFNNYFKLFLKGLPTQRTASAIAP